MVRSASSKRGQKSHLAELGEISTDNFKISWSFVVCATSLSFSGTYKFFAKVVTFYCNCKWWNKLLTAWHFVTFKRTATQGEFL